jgi:hypothetical protein
MVTDSNRAVPSPKRYRTFVLGAVFADTSSTATTMMQSDSRTELNLATATVCDLVVWDPV